MKIFITGGTSGIGLALAKAYLTEGHEVGICGRDISKLPDGLSVEFSKLKSYRVDVSNRQELLTAIEEFSNDGLDILIANAGISEGEKPKLPNFESFKNIIDINTNGVLYAFEGAFQVMQKQERGQLVAIASVAGFTGLPGAGAYCASKSAVIKLCESLSIDLRDLGIHVTTICPGFIDTPLTRKNNHPMPFIMSAEKGAQKIKRAIDKRKYLYIFPFRMKIIVTILDKMPRFIYRRIWKIPGISRN